MNVTYAAEPKLPSDLRPSPEALAWRIRWVAMLRSGEYTQGTSLLRTEDDNFCCLGVACDMSIRESKVDMYGAQWVKENGEWRVLVGGSKQGAVMPLPICGMYAIDDVGTIDTGYPDGEGSKLAFQLSELNDGTYVHSDAYEKYCIDELNAFAAPHPQFTFDMIADIIEYFLITPYIFKEAQS